jgi:hypothetical protein
MESILAWIGLGAGILGAATSFVTASLAPQPPPAQRPRIAPGLVLGIVLTAIFFLLTLPTQPPFSPGQRLGWGFLIGGAVGLVAAVGAARTDRADRSYWPYPAAVTLSLALAGCSLVILLFRGDPTDALLGCALGLAMIGGIFRTILPTQPAAAEAGDPVDAPLAAYALEASAIMAVTLAAGCSLAVYHFHESGLRGWWAYLPALASLWIAGQTVASIPSAHRVVARYPLLWAMAAAAFSLVLVLVFGWRVGAKLEPAESLGLLLVAGSVTAALIAWLAIGAEDKPWLGAVRAHALGAMLMLFLVVLSFKLLAGFGAAVALMVGWAVAGPLLGLRSPARRAPAQALAVGANLLLLRLFLERSGGTVGEVELSLHYALIGVVIGALLPFVYSSLHLRRGLGRTLMLGALGALSPVALLALWGPDAALGLLAGLVGAQALALMLLPLAQANPEVALWQAPTSLLALGTALVAAQFSRPFAFLYDMPRVYKTYLAVGIAAAVILWVIAMALVQWRGRKRSPAPAAPVAGPEG